MQKCTYMKRARTKNSSFYLIRMQYDLYGRNNLIFSSFWLRTQNEILQNKITLKLLFLLFRTPFLFDVMLCPTKKNIM